MEDIFPYYSILKKDPFKYTFREEMILLDDWRKFPSFSFALPGVAMLGIFLEAKGHPLDSQSGHVPGLWA